MAGRAWAADHRCHTCSACRPAEKSRRWSLCLELAGLALEAVVDLLVDLSVLTAAVLLHFNQQTVS